MDGVREEEKGAGEPVLERTGRSEALNKLRDSEPLAYSRST
jgi:hypothetical protein